MPRTTVGTMAIAATILVAAGMLPSPAVAHVTLLYPVGGETIAAGSRVVIEWRLDIPHDQENWDLYYSTDGGATWHVVALDLGLSVRSYDWVVPDVETDLAEVRVVQDNATVDYQSISGYVTIRSLATVVEGPAERPGSVFTIDAFPNPAGSFVVFETGGSAAGPARLDVYDVLGRHVATRLVDAGVRRVRWEPDGLPGGTYLCRLTRDGRSVTLALQIRR